jgi:type II secretory pathway pseudopilin PulG
MTRQVAGSLLVALAIVAITIAIVTARLGTTSSAELELREERIEQLEERREERAERLEEMREQR